MGALRAGGTAVAVCVREAFRPTGLGRPFTNATSRDLATTVLHDARGSHSCSTTASSAPTLATGDERARATARSRRGAVVLSIGKLPAGPTAARYYVEQVAQGREDYYAGEGEAPGTWVGSGATSLALRGEVTEGGITLLLDGRDPGSGAQLRRPLASRAVAGFDVTFRAPKSLSVLFGIGESELADAL